MLSGFDQADVTDDQDGLYAIAHQKALNFPTGTEWSYSNTGYFLLSVVVKRVTGKTLAVFAKERIFEPLGMKNTIFLDDHTRIIPRRATGYAPRAKGGGFGIRMSNFDQTGDGAVQTTVEDLALWDANFYDPKVGTRATLDLMRTPGKLDDGTPVKYAMGLFEGSANGTPVEDHGGAWAGFRANITRFPTERLTVACLCNVTSAEPDDLAHAVAATFLPKVAEPAPAAPSQTASAPAAHGSAGPSLTLLAPVVGTYYDPVSYEVRRISLQNGAIVLDFQLPPGGFHRELEALDAHTFVVLGVPRASATRYLFEPATAKTPAHLVRKPIDGKATTLVRFEPVSPEASELAEYAGRYGSDEILHDVQVGVSDDAFVIGEWGRTFAAKLAPLARDVFVGGGVGLHFERDARGHIKGFTMSADRMLGIEWVRREAPKPRR